MMRTCVRAGKIQTPEATCVRTHVRIKTAKKSYMQNSNPMKNRSRLLPLRYALGMGKALFYKCSRKRKSTILRVDAKSIVRVKNEVLNGNKSAVIRKQKKLRKFIALKCERILQ